MIVFVHDLSLTAHIGAMAHERTRSQLITVNIEAKVTPPEIDAIEVTVDYTSLADAARALAAGPRITLAETFASRLADCCCALPGVLGVMVSLGKSEPLAPAVVGARVLRGDFP